MYYLRSKPAANAIQFTVDRFATLPSSRSKSKGEGGGEDSDEDGGSGGGQAACTDDVCLSCQG